VGEGSGTTTAAINLVIWISLKHLAAIRVGYGLAGDDDTQVVKNEKRLLLSETLYYISACRSLIHFFGRFLPHTSFTYLMSRSSMAVL